MAKFLSFTRSCVFTHAQRPTQNPPYESSSFWAGFCLLNQNSVTKTVRLYFWLFHSYFGMPGKNFPLHVMLLLVFNLLFLKPEPETSPPSSIFKKINPSFRGEKYPGHGFSPQSMAQAHHGLCFISGTKPSQLGGLRGILGYSRGSALALV